MTEVQDLGEIPLDLKLVGSNCCLDHVPLCLSFVLQDLKREENNYWLCRDSLVVSKALPDQMLAEDNCYSDQAFRWVEDWRSQFASLEGKSSGQAVRYKVGFL